MHQLQQLDRQSEPADLGYDAFSPENSPSSFEIGGYQTAPSRYTSFRTELPVKTSYETGLRLNFDGENADLLGNNENLYSPKKLLEAQLTHQLYTSTEIQSDFLDSQSELAVRDYNMDAPAVTAFDDLALERQFQSSYFASLSGEIRQVSLDSNHCRGSSSTALNTLEQSVALAEDASVGDPEPLILPLGKSGAKLDKTGVNARSKQVRKKRNPSRQNVAPRTIKSDEQVVKLMNFFTNLRGPITKKVRREAVALTGLEWSKIYKWVYDRGNCLPEVRTKVIVKLEDKTFRDVQLFKIERVSRH